jgi:hypothetical protein
LSRQDLAATSADSRERFEARRLLPGMAKRLREVRRTQHFRIHDPCTVRVHACAPRRLDRELI